MPWTELPALRNQRSRTYQDDQEPRKRLWSGTLAALHYESEPDSAVYDTEVDLTPVRVDNPTFDGWRVTTSGWHYALGRDLANHGDQDGWVGFGGRQGAHWLKFRLLRTGYLHWPTREWQDIGGSPSYDRANLSQQTHALAIGPNDDIVQASSSATWASIWTTPGGGQLDITWHMSGDRLKEDITIDQAAREWIAANRPPTTPLNETYFGFMFKLDWSDVPGLTRAGELLDPDSDFDTISENIELRDALDRLLGFMPLSYVTVADESLDVIERHALRKRFWKDADGNHYLLVGVRCDVLNGMAAGRLVFDPTVEKVIVAGGDDGRCRSDAAFDAGANAVWAGKEYNKDYDAFFRWTGVTISGTITVSYMKAWVDALTGAPDLKVYGVDQDNPAAPTSCAEYDADPVTDAAVDWDTVDTVDAWEQSPSLNAIFQEIVNSHTIAADAVMLQVKNDQAADSQIVQFRALDHGGGNPAELHIEYTTGTGAAVQMIDHKRRRV